MNRIVFAGKIENAGEARVNKYFEFIIPEKDGNGGQIACAEKKSDGGKVVSFGRNEIAVIPPYFKYVAEACGAGDIHVLVEQAMLPLKEPFTMPDVENGGIRHAATQAAEYFGSEYNNREIVLSALGNLLVSYVNLILGEGQKLSPAVVLVRDDIENNLSDTTYSLEDCIRRLPHNYDYIRKLFKKETGLTPHEYLTAKRMERASGLLSSGITNRYSNYTVSQVAEACGFAEPLYFSRVFKKYFGVSPSEYSKRSE